MRVMGVVKLTFLTDDINFQRRFDLYVYTHFCVNLIIVSGEYIIYCQQDHHVCTTIDVLLLIVLS
jgi:hypothetical protein